MNPPLQSHRKILFLTVLFTLLLVSFRSGYAQSEGAPTASAPENSWTGEVAGKVVNNLKSDAALGSLELMLHGWDQDEQEKANLTGITDPDGSFHFEAVAFSPGVTYMVIASYQGVNYYSESVQVSEGQTSLTLDVPVYETTTDVSQVSIDQKHTIFYFDHNGLSISEVYILSNTGQATVKDAQTLEDGQKGALKFPLPEGATDVQFSSPSPDRFVQTSDGFVDTSPLPPGVEASQVMVSYSLPYASGLTFSYQAPYPTKGVSWLLQQGSGVSLEGEGITSLGPRTLSEGMDFEIYSSGELRAGDKVQIKLSGKPNVAAEESMAAMSSVKKENSKIPLAIGGVIFGLVLLGVGYHWWRKPVGNEGEEAEESKDQSAGRAGESSLDEVITRIALLDSAYDLGEIQEENYRSERSTLLEAARIIAASSK